MRAGKLRQRVTIQSQTTARDDFGGETVTWSDVATVWASIEPLNGREYMAAQQLQTAVTTRIRVRYIDGVTAAMRVKADDVAYDIQSVINPNDRGAELTLMCIERSSDNG
jgi:SPP1 family predicted phage head-tail adaptor